MTCGFQKELLSAYLDNELRPAEVQEVKDHLRICTECVRDLKALQSTIKEAHQWPAMSAPSEVTRHIRESIGIRSEQPAKVHVFPRRWVVSAVAAAAMALMVITVVTVMRPSEDHARSPEIAQEAGSRSKADDRATATKPEYRVGKEFAEKKQNLGDSDTSVEKMKSLEEKNKLARRDRNEAEKDTALPASTAQSAGPSTAGASVPATVILTVTSSDPAGDQKRVAEIVSRLGQNRADGWRGTEGGGYLKTSPGASYMHLKCNAQELKTLNDDLAAAAPGRIQKSEWNAPEGAKNSSVEAMDQLAGTFAREIMTGKDQQSKTESQDGDGKSIAKDERYDLNGKKGDAEPANPAPQEIARAKEAERLEKENRAFKQESSLDEESKKRTPSVEEPKVQTRAEENPAKGLEGAGNQPAQPLADKSSDPEAISSRGQAADPRRSVLILIVPQVSAEMQKK